MDTPDEIRYNTWWEKEGRYIEDAMRDHPCYSCKSFEQCRKDKGDYDFEICEEYEEE